MGKSLVIVESPTKAKTIAGFLPKGFVVESSFGHVRDLPPSAKEIPADVKGEPWAKLGVNVEKDFEPLYVVPATKKKQVAKLKSLLKDASTLYLATDEDREGESMSWHLVQVLKPRIPQQRLVFHEITREAIREALDNLRPIDDKLVEAQETRRIVDRLYGYQVSEVLWREIAPRLSAGRVQSVAVRMIVERERERQRFRKSVYWDLAARFRKDSAEFEAVLVSLGGQRVASGNDFDKATGKLRETDGKPPRLIGEAEAKDLAERLRSSAWRVDSVERKPFTWKPPAPFTTSTLQQEANRKLRVSSKETMRAAQRLYENGFITYMRTDSTTLSESAIKSARELIERLYGGEYLSPTVQKYQTKVKNAQEAHEAIRPATEFRLPETIRGEVGGLEHRIYEMIWMRTVACQMVEARGHHIAVEVSDEEAPAVAAPRRDHPAVFRANGKTIEFPGYLRAYVEGADDPEAELADKETLLPAVDVKDPLECAGMDAKEHTTNPPHRFTEASLVKELEANGIGRPSTYATIIDTIQEREYVVKQGNSLVPTFMAFAVVGLLEKNFEDLVDFEFTARMEDDLDAISRGEGERLPYLKSFYYGVRGGSGLQKLLKKEIDARASCTLPLGEDESGKAINVRIGRYGPYLERGEDRASIPAGMAPDELTIEKAQEILAQDSGPRSLGSDPGTGKSVYVKVGRFGPYVQLGENDDSPKMKSILPGMDKDAVTLDEALRLLSLPRSLGADPETGEEVFADFGRFGPYLKRGKDTRSIPKEEDLFQIALERAREIFKQEKRGRGWRRTPAVLRELGERPDSKVPVKLLDGRYGPYVTDGTTNASIPKGANPAEVTIEQAVELLQAREAAGPPKPRRGKAGGWKKKAPAGAAAGGEPRAKAGGAEAPSGARKKKSTAKASTRSR